MKTLYFSTEKQRAQGFVEYALLVALIVVTVILVLRAFGITLSDIYCALSSLFGAEPDVCQNDLVLQDGFDNLDQWNFTAGSGWRLEDGMLCVRSGGEHRGFTGQTDWDNYTVKVDIAELYQGNGYGVYFRVSNEPAINGYAFQYDPGYVGGSYPNGAFLIRRVTNGSETPPVAVAPAPLDWQWKDIRRDIQIVVDEDLFTVFIDGAQVLQGHDSTYQIGRAGLRSWDSTQVCFDDFSVERH